MSSSRAETLDQTAVDAPAPEARDARCMSARQQGVGNLDSPPRAPHAAPDDAAVVTAAAAVAAGSSGARAAVVRSAQVRAVGAAFLRRRPLIVAPAVAANLALVVAAGVPVAQRLALGGAFGLALALFTLEALSLRRRAVAEATLFRSLLATLAGLALGAALSGGLASPFLPLVFAPVVTAFAAFGRRRASGVMLASVALAALALAAIPRGVPWPPIAPPYATGVTLVSLLASVALLGAGVAGLSDAYDRAGATLDRMRLDAIEEAASRMRGMEALGARVAHEVKNPLAAVKALAQLLERAAQEQGDAKAQRRLEVVTREVARIEAILGDYLSFARPLADLRVGPVDLAALCDELLAVLEARAAAAGVALERRDLRGAAARGAVHADARRVKEALLNLLTNALEASPRGGRVTLALREPPPAARGGCVIEVADQGGGIAPALRGRLGVEPFVTTREGGTGLGVTLARAVIAQHGGALAYRDRPGGGTIAEVTLPAEPGGALEVRA